MNKLSRVRRFGITNCRELAPLTITESFKVRNGSISQSKFLVNDLESYMNDRTKNAGCTE